MPRSHGRQTEDTVHAVRVIDPARVDVVYCAIFCVGGAACVVLSSRAQHTLPPTFNHAVCRAEVGPERPLSPSCVGKRNQKWHGVSCSLTAYTSSKSPTIWKTGEDASLIRRNQERGRESNSHTRVNQKHPGTAVKVSVKHLPESPALVDADTSDSHG